MYTSCVLGLHTRPAVKHLSCSFLNNNRIVDQKGARFINVALAFHMHMLVSEFALVVLTTCRFSRGRWAASFVLGDTYSCTPECSAADRYWRYGPPYKRWAEVELGCGNTVSLQISRPGGSHAPACLHTIDSDECWLFVYSCDLFSKHSNKTSGLQHTFLVMHADGPCYDMHANRPCYEKITLRTPKTCVSSPPFWPTIRRPPPPEGPSWSGWNPKRST